MNEYARTPSELQQTALMFWPRELLQREATASIIPLLIQTQDKFISLLDLSDAEPDAWKSTLPGSKGLTPNLFLKHLMVLSDISGERLKRLKFHRIFPDGVMEYIWQQKTYNYHFKAITRERGVIVSNQSLFVDGPGLVVEHPLDPKIEDIIMLILHGQASIDVQEARDKLPEEIRSKCMIGSLIGNSKELNRFVKERYIWVSRITGGATANAMGQMAQNYVLETLRGLLPQWHMNRDRTIPGISHNQGVTETHFDIVARSPRDKYVAIEVCFQVTTNSVIERKAGQAEARAAMLRNAGHRIAYVIDGAGNFERSAALNTICANSDCTVAFSANEMQVLASFLTEFDTMDS